MDKELEDKIKNLRDDSKKVYDMVSENIRGHTAIEVSNRLMLTPTEATNLLEDLRKDELLGIYRCKYVKSENISCLEDMDKIKIHSPFVKKWHPKGSRR